MEFEEYASQFPLYSEWAVSTRKVQRRNQKGTEGETQ